MLNYIKLVKQIRRDYLNGNKKETYTYQDLIAIRITEETVEDYEEVGGTYLEEAAYSDNLYLVTNTNNDFELYVTIDEYDFIANYIL